MNAIQISLVSIFLLIALAFFLLLKINPFEAEKNPLKQRRLYLSGAKLRITERVVLRFTTLFRQTRYTLKKISPYGCRSFYRRFCGRRFIV